jgi:hypothetical protein
VLPFLAYVLTRETTKRSTVLHFEAVLLLFKQCTMSQKSALVLFPRSSEPKDGLIQPFAFHAGVITRPAAPSIQFIDLSFLSIAKHFLPSKASDFLSHFTSGMSSSYLWNGKATVVKLKHPIILPLLLYSAMIFFRTSTM